MGRERFFTVVGHLAGEEPGNRRNGYGKKTVITDTG
jgi:hypothetical protein